MLTDRRVQQLVREGWIEKSVRARYDLVGSVQGYIRFLKHSAESRSEPVDAGLAEQRLRLAREQADALELKNQQARGELVPGDQVEGFGVAIFSGVRSRVLAVPSKAAPRVHGAETIAETESLIREHLTEALEDLAEEGARLYPG
jgi:phage terminase Nu1 subunit (DNA packaging protein)